MSFQPGTAGAQDTEHILDVVPSGHVSLENAEPCGRPKNPPTP